MASSTGRSVAARSVASLLLALALLAAAAVSAQAAGSVYVGNWGNDSLTQFPLDTAGGLFAFGAATVDSGTQPMQVAVSPDGDSVYAVGGSGVWEYDVNHATGALTAKRVAPLLAADQVGQGIAVSPDGKHVYVSSIVTSSFSGFLSTFDVDATDGTLTFTSSRSSVLGILGLAVSPDGKRLIAAGANQVLQYDLDAAGVPTAKTAVNLGGTPRAAEVVISPDSASAYVSDLGNSGVFELNISPVNGALSGKSPGFVRAGSGAIGIARSADGRSVYVTNQNGNSITQFDVGSGGLLTAKPAGAVAAPGGPQDIALSRDGATAYVANSDGTISQYDVDPVSGALAVKAPVVTPGAPSAGHSNSMFGIATGIYPNAPSARSSSTSVSCPDTVVGVATTCTATVTDASDAPTAPVGTVSFDNGMTCTLSGTGAAPGCSIQVTPTAIGTTSLTASYGGDTIHRASQSSADFVTRLATSTTLTCSPTSFTLNASTSCTATVTDTSAAPTAPDGTVSVEGTTCALTADASGDSASCSLDKTPASAGDHDLAADYSGSATHAASSSDPVTISVAKRTDTVALSCSPDSVAIHASTTCTATVSDTDAGTASAPDGTITLTRAACDDRFVGFCSRIDVRVGSCALAPDTGSLTASCAVDDTPSAVGPEELTARYSGATHADAASDPATVTVVKRATTTVADCPTATVPVNTVARCTVTVTDVDAGAKSAPRGFVANPHHELWIRPDGGCVLVPDTGGTSSSCSFDIAQPYLGPLMAGQFPGFPGSPVAVDYEPEPFSDDHDHARSSVTLSAIFGERATATAVACDPSAPAVGQATTCTATVSDADGDGASAPDGTVGFASAGGSFSAASCTPVADAVDPTASCAVQYTPDAAGDHIVTAALTGATKHFDSSGSTTVSVPAPCTRSGATLNVRLGSGAATLSRATDGTLQLGASPCADATTSNVGTIDVTGAGGDDDVTLDLSGGGFGGARVAVDLGEGDDTLTVAGGDGQDSMRLGDAGLAIAGQSAAFVTLSGVDHVRLDGNGAHDTISAAGSSATGAPYSGRVIINGGAGADVLIGGTNDDYIDGGADADNITGGAGDDIEHGGDGNDVFPSGSVADGADQLIGDGGVDRADYSSRRAGVAVTLNGGSADGAAGEGDDVRAENATGGAGADALTGDGGANTLTGGGGADTLEGAGGGDTLAGGAGDDLEHGGDGNDVFPEDAAANGADQLHGDAGIDKVSYAARAAKVTVTLDAAANDGADGEGDDAEAENIDGGKGDDDVTGDGLANTLVGNAGADELRGMGGNDTLTGGTGADSLLGGEGADILDGTLDADADTCDGGPGANRIKNCP